MSACKKCNEEKDETEYYANDRTCKECRKVAVRKNRAEKADYYRQYDRERFQSDPKVRARHKRYQQTDAGKESLAASRKKYAENNREKIYLNTVEYRAAFPKKYAAHKAIQTAKMSGYLVPQPCELCGSDKNIHAHHDDYNQPLSVRWLCSYHHRKWHMENGEGLNPI